MSDFNKRLRLAWRALTGRKTVATLFNDVGWTSLTPSYYSTNYESMVKHGYRKNELIYSCITKKANASSQIALTVRRNADADVDDQHPLKLLIQQPNPYMSEFDFWSAIIIFQSLAGRALFEKERSRAGQVVRLWPLRPDWTTPKPQGNLVVAYEFKVPGKDPVTIDAADVVDFSLFDPFLQFDGWPPAAVAARIGDVDNATTDHIKNIWEHGGVPAGLIKSTQRLVKEQVDVIQNQFLERYGGSENWLKPMVLDADADYQKVGFTFQEMGFDVLDARSEARICMVMDVPPILIGAKVGLDRATYANYSEARRAWWQDSWIPMYSSFLDTIQNQLGNEFGNPVIEFDYNGVEALQEERNTRWTRATAAWNAGAITNNEFRLEVGLPERPDGDAFKTAPAPVVVSQENTDDEDADDEEPKRRIIIQTESAPGKGTVPNIWELVKAKAPPDDEERRKHEMKISRGMEDFLSEQLNRILKTLRQKALVDIDAEFWEEEDDELFKVMLPLILAATLKAAELAARNLVDIAGIGVDWALVNQAALAWSRSYSYSLVTGINKTTREVLQSQVGDWIEAGLPLDDLISALAPTFGPVRAEMIGVTETTRAFASGNLITWKESGVVEKKAWYTAEDELVCPICGPLADLEPIGMDQAWQTENGPVTEPPAHPRCRCWLQPYIEVEND